MKPFKNSERSNAKRLPHPTPPPPARMLLVGGLLLGAVLHMDLARAGDQAGQGSHGDTPLAEEEARGRGGSDRAKGRKRAAFQDRVSLESLLGRYAHEPSVEKVQRAAVRLVMAEASGPRRWLRRAARAAWLPKVQVGTGLQQRREEGLDQQAGTASRLRAGAANQLAYEIKLSWDLPRLIFDANTLRVMQQAQRIAELREQVVLQVTRLYFERRRLQLERQLRPATIPATALRQELRLAELTALLDALTGGLFSPERAQQSRRSR